MDNEMLCCVCVGGQMVKDANGSIEYKGRRIITLLVNVHMPLDEFVPLVCGKLGLDSNSFKICCTCKFELLMLVLNDDEQLRKMFRFNDMHCRECICL